MNSNGKMTNLCKAVMNKCEKERLIWEKKT